MYYNNLYLTESDLFMVVEKKEGSYITSNKLYIILSNYFDKNKMDRLSKKLIGSTLKKWGYKLNSLRIEGKLFRCILGLTERQS